MTFDLASKEAKLLDEAILHNAHTPLSLSGMTTKQAEIGLKTIASIHRDGSVAMWHELAFIRAGSNKETVE
jgi:hypothetical protein